MSARLDAAGGPHVTAVIVAHDGERWLPALIAALAASTTAPDLVLAVDSASTDSSRDLLAAAYGGDAVLAVPRSTGFGAAVQAALEVATHRPTDSVSSWIWLLHDDCTPAPDALRRLLETATSDTSIGAVGCRLRAWPRGRRLLEVGVTITGTGHRETGLELGEYDQGQHEELRDVLAVSSAGMLVRRDSWDRLGGFDPRLPLFRDDVDFGWRMAKSGSRVVVAPGAVVFHAEAATRGVRRIANTSTNPQRADRRAALFTVLANCRSVALPLQYVRLLAGSMLRVLGYLLGKLPGAAWHELVAALSVLGRPDRIFAARSRRRSLIGGSPADVRALLPAWWTPYANGIDGVASRFSGGLRSTSSKAAPARRLHTGRAGATAAGPARDQGTDEPARPAPVSGALAHPLLSVLGVLGVAGLLASRGLWGEGFLQGGALPPAPDSAGDWWRLYTQSWHPVRLGSTDVASPYVAALALAGSVLLGKAWLLVDALMLFAPVLAAVGAYVAARRLVSSRGARAWMAATYALLPVVVGATTSGRIGTVVATILLPWLVAPMVTLVGSAGRQALQAACAAAAVLAVMSAFVPVAEAMAAVLVVAAVPWLLVSRRASTIPYCFLVVLLPLALLFPWSKRFVATPQLLLTEAGLFDVSAGPGVAPGWQLAFGRIAAPGDAPWWLTAGIAVVAVLALLRSDRLGDIAGAWIVVAVSLATATVMSRFPVELPGGRHQAFVWLGFPVIVAQAAGIVAAGLAADGLARFIAAGSFGWRQPLAAAAAVVAVLTPLAGLTWWSSVAGDGDLLRSEAVPLPAYMVDAIDADIRLRVLVVRGNTDQATYDVLAGDGLRLGDDSVLPPAGSEQATGLVTDLLAEGTAVSPSRLSALGIRYVVLPRPIDPRLLARLDAVPGLVRVSTSAGQLAGWQVDKEPPTGVSTATWSGPPEQGHQRQLAGQAGLWALVLVLAAPGLHRRDGLAEGER